MTGILGCLFLLLELQDVIAAREKLHSQDPQERIAAATALGRLGPAGKEAAADLCRAFTDQDEGVRCAAKRALRRIGPAVIPELRKALTDEDPCVRRLAVMTLGELGPASESAVVDIGRLLWGKDDRLWPSAVEALGDIGPAAVPELRKALGNTASDIRQSAAETLGEMGPAAADAVPDLRKATRDGEQIVRYVAVRALGDIGPAAKDAVPDLREALHEDLLRRQATKALGKIGPAAQDAVGDIRDLLRHDSEYVRSAAARTLGEIGPAAIAAITDLRKALRDDSVQVQVAAAFALAQVSPENTGEAVRELGRHLDLMWADASHQYAASALGKLGPTAKGAVGDLRRALAGPRESFCSGGGYCWFLPMVWALGEIGDPAQDAIPDLRAIVNERPIPEKAFLRLTAAGALVKLDPATASVSLGVLRAALADSSLHYEAAWSLGQLGPAAKGAVPDLCKMLAERDLILDKRPTDSLVPLSPGQDAAEAAAKALGLIGRSAREALPALRVATCDDSRDVRRAAAEAIKAIEH